MDKIDDGFLKRINATFRIEADEHLNAFSAGLIELEKVLTEEKYAEIIENIPLLKLREYPQFSAGATRLDVAEVLVSKE